MTLMKYAIMDDGCTSTHLMANYPCDDVKLASDPLQISLANASTIHNTHTCNLRYRTLPEKACQVHIVPGLENKALISMATLVDAGSDVWCRKTEFAVHFNQQKSLLPTNANNRSLAFAIDYRCSFYHP